MSVGTPEAALLERAEELDVLATALGAAASGTGRGVLIEGPAGIGKTRLLEESRTLAAASGFRVLYARAGELEQEVAWSVVRRLLGPALRERAPDARAALLADAGALAAPALGVGARLAGPVDEASVSHGLYWLLTALAEECPLALLVDDVQWSDDGSLRWLASMVLGLDELPLALVATVREGEVGGARQAAAALFAAPAVDILRPAPLSSVAVAQLVARLLGHDPDQDFVAACQSLTAGNPFLVAELVGQLSGEGATATAEDAARLGRLRPAAIHRHVLLRLARLPPAATELAQAVAVLGERGDVEFVAALVELDRADLESAFAALVRANVVADETPLRFVHPLVRAVVYEDLPALERHRRHAQAARVLESRHLPREEVAGHLLNTDPAHDRWVRDYLLEAGREVLGRGAPANAVRLLRRAEQECAEDGADRGLLLLLGQAEFALCGARGLDGLRRAWSSSTGGGRAEAALALGRALHAVGNHPEAARVYEATLTEDLDHGIVRSLEAELIPTALQDRSTFPTAQARLTEAAGRIAAGESPKPAILATLALAAAAAGDPGARELAEGALASGELLTEPNTIPLSFAIHALLWRDELARASELWDGAMAAARRSGARPWYRFCACFRAHAAWRAGDIPAAEAFARDALALGAAETWDLVPPDPACYLADALIEQGRLEEAERTIEESGYDRDLPQRQGYNTLLFTRGRLHIARGRIAPGVADLRELGARLEAWTLVSPAAFPWRSTLAEALSDDEPAEARALAAEELERARAAGTPRAVGIALRGAGLVAESRGGLGLLHEAADVLGSSPATLDRARALTDLGASLRRSGRRADARPVLREALDLAHRCGATALEERAREELVTAGARPRRPSVHGRDALTAAELRIARMAARGHTNRQIGQALFLTLRTVETHLTSVYQKLDISGRPALAEHLDDPRA